MRTLLLIEVPTNELSRVDESNFRIHLLFNYRYTVTLNNFYVILIICLITAMSTFDIDVQSKVSSQYIHLYSP